MSDKEFTSAAADNQRAKLEDLITTKKGKGGASQLEAKRFTDAWVAYVKTVGVNDETVRMLYDGFQFAAGEPLYRYVKETHSGTAYASWLASAPTKLNEQGVALKVAINLFVLELPDPTPGDPVRFIAHAIPNLSTNKEGKAFGTLGRSIGKVVAKPLARKTIDKSVSIESSDASMILALLRDPVESFAKSGRSKSVDVTAVTKLLAWLDEQAQQGKASPTTVAEKSEETDSPKHEPGAAENLVNEDEAAAKEARREARRSISERPVRIRKIEPLSASTQPSEESSRASEQPSSAKSQVGDGSPYRAERPRTDVDALDMADVLAFLASYKQEHDSLAKLNEMLREAGRDASSRASHAEAELRGAQREIASLSEQLAGLSENYAKLQAEAVNLRNENKSLSDDLSAAEEMLGMIDRRDARQADESTKRLASELRVEYRDFLDAADLPMDADLGENMREQLKNIFGILASNGIKL